MTFICGLFTPAFLAAGLPTEALAPQSRGAGELHPGAPG
jgi:hypothetical protein